MGNKSFMPSLKENNISKFMLGIDMRLKSK